MKKAPLPRSAPDDSSQMALDWEAAAKAPVVPKRSLRDTFERFLREQGVPYIAVTEARRLLFTPATARLRPFHFVVYRTPGPNWLVFAAWVRPEVREDLRQWEAIFGTGFVAVTAAQSPHGAFRFRTLARESVDLFARQPEAGGSSKSP